MWNLIYTETKLVLCPTTDCIQRWPYSHLCQETREIGALSLCAPQLQQTGIPKLPKGDPSPSALHTTHTCLLPAHPLTLSPDKLRPDLLTQKTFPTSTICCFLGWTSPSSSTFHKGTWIFSILRNTGASHVPVRISSCWRAQSRQFWLFKPSAPLDPFIQTNPIQSHSCLSSLYNFILAGKCTSVPATNISHSLTFRAPPAPF